MKRSISLWTVSALLGVATLGCQEKPEIAFEEYGRTIATFPVVENLPDDYPLPEEADAPTCVMREHAINSAQRERKYISQRSENAAPAPEKSNAASDAPQAK